MVVVAVVAAAVVDDSLRLTPVWFYGMSFDPHPVLIEVEYIFYGYP